MIEMIVFLLIGVIAGVAVTYLVMRGKSELIRVRMETAEADSRRISTEADESRRRAESAAEAVERGRNAEMELRVSQERLASAEATIAELNARIAKEQESARAMLQAADERLTAEQTHSARLRAEADRQWMLKFDALTKELQSRSAEQLAARQSALQETNRSQLDALLKPVKEQFEAFRKSVEESRTMTELSKKEISATFESTLKLFQQQQAHAVSSLREQTERIGTDAANLTRALKSETKTQGDWGEMVLETILENSGLQRDEEFFVQENVKDEHGNNLRPDVVVRFPEGRSVVIDSKVSLTAYADAMAAATDEERERAMRDHVRSVRRHVDELAEKKYDRLVDDAIGFVLMFIPNESSYIAAMKQQPDLSRYAYSKRIIIISPSNLLMALQLAYNLWQYDRQGKNVEKIVKTAADLYDKVVLFEDSFYDIDAQLVKLRNTYEEARSRLFTGKGSVLTRMDTLRTLGVTPKKKLRSSEEQ